jgi:hypothetical protein
LNPILNLNVISSEPSVLDKRANIYYPVKIDAENKNLFDLAGSNNISQSFRIKVENQSIYPDEIYIMNEIYRVLKYSSDKRDKLVDHIGIERSIHEIVQRYYSNFDECFITDNKLVFNHDSNRNSVNYDLMITDHISREYYHNRQNSDKLYTFRIAGSKNAITKAEHSIKLFDSSQSNDFLFPVSSREVTVARSKC